MRSLFVLAEESDLLNFVRHFDQDEISVARCCDSEPELQVLLIQMPALMVCVVLLRVTTRIYREFDTACRNEDDRISLLTLSVLLLLGVEEPALDFGRYMADASSVTVGSNADGIELNTLSLLRTPQDVGIAEHLEYGKGGT